MPTPNDRTVTAQDFLELCCDVDDEFNKLRTKTLILPEFESLLSRARQEARREALKEMDEAHMVLEYASSTNNAKEQKLEFAFIEKLRQEYQQPN